MSNLNIINLCDYRGKHRREYCKKNQRHLVKFLNSFISTNFHVSYDVIEHYYIIETSPEHFLDYQELRERLKIAIGNIYGELMWQEINKQLWFDPKWISYDALIEQCVSAYILGRDDAIALVEHDY